MSRVIIETLKAQAETEISAVVETHLKAIDAVFKRGDFKNISEVDFQIIIKALVHFSEVGVLTIATKSNISDRAILQWMDGANIPVYNRENFLKILGSVTELKFTQKSFLSFLFDEIEQPPSRERLPYSTPISEFRLHSRAHRALLSLGETLGEILICTQAEILRLEGFGKKALRELNDILDENGYHLGVDYTNSESWPGLEEYLDSLKASKETPTGS